MRTRQASSAGVRPACRAWLTGRDVGASAIAEVPAVAKLRALLVDLMIHSRALPILAAILALAFILSPLSTTFVVVCSLKRRLKMIGSGLIEIIRPWHLNPWAESLNPV